MSTNTNVGSSSRAVGMVFSIFAILSLIANAVLTGLFGMAFLSGALGVVLMLLFFDGAALAWYCARQATNLSGDQRAIAKIMSVATIVGSTLVSVVQVLDMASAIEAGGWGHTFAVWLVTAFAAFNFFALFAYQYTSVKERAVDMQEELTAQTNDQVSEMTREAHAKAMTRAQRVLMAKTDIIGDRIAYDVERDFLRAMGSLDLLGESPAVAPAPPKADNAAGEAAGAKTVSRPAPSAPASPTQSLSEDCECGMPIGTEEGECDFELGGAGCMIDMKAEEARALREANTTPPSEYRTATTAADLTALANQYLAAHGNLDGFREWHDTEVGHEDGHGMTFAEIDQSITEMIANSKLEILPGK